MPQTRETLKLANLQALLDMHEEALLREQESQRREERRAAEGRHGEARRAHRLAWILPGSSRLSLRRSTLDREPTSCRI
jgi:hypothetical protein